MVDDKWYDFLNQWRWRILVSVKKTVIRNYVYRTEKVDGKPKAIFMHRIILGLKDKDTLVSDHINHNGLDNQESNLRKATVTENNRNRSKTKNRPSKYLGVCKTKNGTYQAYLTHNYKKYKSRVFPTQEQAALAYNELAIFHHKEFANLNQL